MKESLVREKEKIVSCFSIFIGTLPNKTLLRNLIGRQKKCAVTCPQVLNMDKHGVERRN